MNYGNIIKKELIPYLEETCSRYEINTIFRVAHFVSQAAHESNNFTVKVENLNYSANGLARTWKARFAKKDIKGNYFEPIQPNELALAIQHLPQKIANTVYANRLGNGDEASNDGWNYRGRAFFQTTGKDNYKMTGTELGIDLLKNPDLLLEDNYAMLSAGVFWKKNRLWLIADAGSTEDSVRKMTKRINGGFIGLPDRLDKFNKIFTELKTING